MPAETLLWGESPGHPCPGDAGPGACTWPGQLGLERRTVSVLFADIVGFTATAGALDIEDVRALQRGYFRAVTEVVRQWGGVVEKYVGDAVMALFGVPCADEHDAYRAV